MFLGCVEGFEIGTQGSEEEISTFGTKKVESLADARRFFSTSQVQSSLKWPSTLIHQHSCGRSQ